MSGLNAGGRLEHIAARVMSVAPNAETRARAGMEGMRITLEALSKKNPSLQALHDVWAGLYTQHRAAGQLSVERRPPSVPARATPPRPPPGSSPLTEKPIVGLVQTVTQLVEDHDLARRAGDTRRAALARATFEKHMWRAMGVRYALPPFAWE